MSVNRRDFLKQLGVLGAGVAAGGTAARPALASSGHAVNDDGVGVLVDLTKCNGCRRCEAACQQANGFEAPSEEQLKDTSIFEETRHPDTTHYTTINRFEQQGEYTKNGAVFVKNNCFHCLDPACVSACLVKAMEKQPNGAVTYDPWKCMGCRYCMVACPFQMPTYEYDNVFTPQVRKCTLCMGEGNPNAGGVPACVKACPMECLSYGKRKDLLQLAHEKIAESPDRYIDHVYGEHEAGGTSWLYLSAYPFEELGFIDVPHESRPRLAESIQHGVFKHFVPPIAWVAILGMSMWLTRPDQDKASDEDRSGHSAKNADEHEAHTAEESAPQGVA